MRPNPVLAHSFLSVFKEGSFVWITIEGGVICCAFQFDKEDCHTYDAVTQGSSSENKVFFYP